MVIGKPPLATTHVCMMGSGKGEEEKKKLVFRMFCIYYDRITSLGACTPILKPIRRRVFQTNRPGRIIAVLLLVLVTRPGERRTTAFTVCADGVGRRKERHRKRKIEEANKQYPS